MLRRLVLVLLAAVLAACSAAGAAPARDPNVAALQVGLRAHGVYHGPVDGLAGVRTFAAVRRLGGDSLFGWRTLHRLGKFARHPLGSRPVLDGTVGWDAAAIQFMLAWHGFPSATFDGAFGSHSDRALRKFERWAGLPQDGVAGPAVIAALQRPPATCPIALRPPLATPYTDGFGPRGNRFHTGVDYPAPRGTPVGAAANGRVSWAGNLGGGWGNVVTIQHPHGVATMYAHLSKVLVSVGRHVTVGERIGFVGATGDASGPHVHFEVRVRGAAVDPLTGLS
ncbi:MAG TPA: peptidoglycan DD-metalloendopeptidase family protein [Gaiellaceae bacterium]|nr:peptidoglycan DD-metalloendopeptidase family protein [Gaiellaceae bacterium]